MDEELPLNPALLPAGLRDLLPPDAETEAAGVEAAMAMFAAHAYHRVQPPLLEFEDSYLSGMGAALADQGFRIMDPESHRMMVLRADMTPQIARIAATRLGGEPRPLRLAYSGTCVRVRGGRQVRQAGIELIGTDSAAADAEVMAVAVEALSALGLQSLSLDLTLPNLIPALLDDAGITGAEHLALTRALDRKDAAAVAAHGGALSPMLTTLLLAAGPAEGALAALREAALPAPCRELADRLAQVIALLAARVPGLRVTVDPVEFRGFRYHTGIALTLYSPGRHEELGRGGRYVSAGSEPATGITLYADAALRAAARPAPPPCVYVPAGTQPASAAALREQGFSTLAGLEKVADDAAEAARLRCTHVLRGGKPIELGG